ncbi:hypothetical protein [Bradyrhizobium sp.]|uniref:hypothetical protein n=1 Tax=Bradyrhizobium sp. TaxID=376 RepID=UPI001D6148FF|nr:hypothetical protein [Bradyrhizobium sp.]MBI5319316.1 hypothetical protein [Bradyrhizobium sp.]
MHPLRNIEDDQHQAPIAPDIVPADWADCVPRPANDATSREKLFAEIRHAAEAAAPEVDNTFRATDVNATPVLDSSSRAWIRRAGTAFVIALIGVVGAAVWTHHGDTATQTVAGLVPLPGVSTSPAAEPAEPAAPPAPPVQPMDLTRHAAPTASGTAAMPPEAEQQIQSLTRDLAAMTQQVELLKAQIETLKASQQAAVAPAPPVARAPAPKPPAQRVALPPRPIPVAPAQRAAYPPATQAAAAPPPAATMAPPPAYQPPPQPYAPPPQATTQPNGEPIVRPPMPLPLSDRY